MKRSNRARRINIRIKPIEGVSVSVPIGVSYDSAIEFVKSRESWIVRHLDRFSEIEARRTVFTEEIEFYTRQRKLIINESKTDRSTVRVYNHQIRAAYPKGSDVRSDEFQQQVRAGVEKAWRLEAKEYLPKRVGKFASQYNLTFNKVQVRNSKTRWGSCSYNNNINLNLHLMRIPGHLCDYVILHELAHTIEKNHGPAFWSLLDSMCGDARKLDKELKDHHIKIY